MPHKWEAIQYDGTWWVFKGGALLDPWTKRFAIKGGQYQAETLAALLNGKDLQ